MTDWERCFNGECYDSFVKQAEKSLRFDNMMKKYVIHCNEISYEPDEDILNHVLRDFSKLKKFTELIPIDYGYAFHKGDSYLIKNNRHMRIGYGDPDQIILRILLKNGYTLNEANELCIDVASALDVSIFRQLVTDPTLGNVTHARDCVCPDCNTKNPTVIKKRNTVTGSLRHECLKRDRHRCCDCGATNHETTLEIDHILPVSQGGTNELDNLQTLCKDCNRSKYNRCWRGGE